MLLVTVAVLGLIILALGGSRLAGPEHHFAGYAVAAMLAVILIVVWALGQS